jgi:Integrase zinc binding domain
LCQAKNEVIRQEQLSDDTLASCWSLAKRNKGGYFVKDDLLYHTEQFIGQVLIQLCVPVQRRKTVLDLAHGLYGGHLASQKTRDRIRMSGMTWPTIMSDCKKWVKECTECQHKSRVTVYDRVPITAVPRANAVFSR